MKKRKIIFVKDSQINQWLIEEFERTELEVDFIHLQASLTYRNRSRIVRVLYLHSQYFFSAMRALGRSNTNDVIVCWLDVMALYVYLGSLFTLRKRTIVALNLMYNKSPDALSVIKYKLFEFLLSGKDVYITVTSEYLKKYYSKIFTVYDKTYYLLHDTYGSLGVLQKEYSPGHNYIFSGGTNSRDWQLVLGAAKLLPEYKFKVVVPQISTLGTDIPNNVDCYHNISSDRFNELLSNSSLCVLPLTTEAPAGLIVLYSAGLLSVPVITSNNASMNEYIENWDNGVLIGLGDLPSFTSAVAFLLSDPELLEILGRSLQEKIMLMGSTEKYIDKLSVIIDNIQNENPSNK